jgi:hypothetical protein
VNPDSGLAREIRHIVMSLFIGACIDGIDLHQSAVAEHWARRLLQLQKAIRRSAKSPSFEGLEYYMYHCTPAGEGIAAPLFDSEVAAHAKDNAQILKQLRLAKEERDTVDKPPKDKRKKGGRGNGSAEAEAPG